MPLGEGEFIALINLVENVAPHHIFLKFLRELFRIPTNTNFVSRVFPLRILSAYLPASLFR